jgi:hypothetical protein
MDRLPHETYISLLLANGMPLMEAQDELRLLRLELPDDELQAYLIRSTPLLKPPRGRKPKDPKKALSKTQPLYEWADTQGLDRELVNLNNARVRAARRICFSGQVRHGLQICLLKPGLSWKDVKDDVQLAGQIPGLTVQVIRDFQALFWDFRLMLPPERARYFDRCGATPGMYAALKGDPKLGMAIDFAADIEFSDEDRIQCALDLTHATWMSDLLCGRSSATDSRNWAITQSLLRAELKQFRPTEGKNLIEFNAGVVDTIPSIDHLDLLEDLEAMEEQHDGKRTEQSGQARQLQAAKLIHLKTR